MTIVINITGKPVEDIETISAVIKVYTLLDYPKIQGFTKLEDVCWTYRVSYDSSYVEREVSDWQDVHQS